ncbi:MAG: hypothetical protein ACFN20_06120 [Bacteroidota bacterium]
MYEQNRIKQCPEVIILSYSNNNIYGTEVAHSDDTDRVEVSHLPAGVYTFRADGTVAKMVKTLTCLNEKLRSKNEGAGLVWLVSFLFSPYTAQQFND